MRVNFAVCGKNIAGKIQENHVKIALNRYFPEQSTRL